uniref:Chromosome 5 open reading frame 34 n=1 Tax=Monodelphis domestica TaxID=13616 RepID=A0A5F8GDE8_MONDO
METEVRMVLYEDDSVEVHYIDGSKLQLSPCGSEYLFEKAPPISAHPLQQPERIRQRTQFVISNYREQLLRALDFRNCFSSRPFLPESIIPSERKQSVFTDISEVRWPSPDTHNAVICLGDGMVKISSLDGYASLCLPKEQHEFTIRFLCKISQRSHSLSEKKSNNLKKVDKHCGKASKNCMFRASSDGPSLKNKENDSYCHFTKSKEVLGANNFINGSEGKELAPLYHKKYTFVYIWVKQCWSVDSCPEEWKYPLSLAFNFLHKLNNTLKADQTASQITVLASCISKEGDKVSVLPRALPLSCHNPHLHRWNFSDSSLQEQEYIYPELIKVVWYKGTVFRLTHETVNSIEIFPGDGSILKSEGTFWGNYFTLSSVHKGSEQKEEKMYSIQNLPPDRPGSPYSVCSLIIQASRILRHCVKTRLSLSHNYNICCWKMANQGVTLGWCKLTLPDGQDQLIQIEHPGQFERYVAAVVDWCRSLTRANPQKMLTYPSSSSITEEKWSIISELEKIQKFNFLLENDSILNQISTKKTEQSSSDVSRSRSSEPYSCFEEVNKKSVSIALKKTSEILQDIESLLACSKK